MGMSFQLAIAMLVSQRVPSRDLRYPHLSGNGKESSEVPFGRGYVSLPGKILFRNKPTFLLKKDL